MAFYTVDLSSGFCARCVSSGLVWSGLAETTMGVAEMRAGRSHNGGGWRPILHGDKCPYWHVVEPFW